MSNPNCIFCQIVAGSAPSAKVYEDDAVLVFLDIFPASAGHTLIIPRQHFENLYETPPELLQSVMRTSRRIALAMRSAFQPDGLFVGQLNGAAAGQTVFHYHMHLVPRSAGDPFVIHGRKLADPNELAAIADRLRAALETVA